MLNIKMPSTWKKLLFCSIVYLCLLNVVSIAIDNSGYPNNRNDGIYPWNRRTTPKVKPIKKLIFNRRETKLPKRDVNAVQMYDSMAVLPRATLSPDAEIFLPPNSNIYDAILRSLARVNVAQPLVSGRTYPQSYEPPSSMSSPYSPYAAASSPYDSASSPFASASSPYASASSPYESASSPFASESSPYGSASISSPYDSGSSAYDSASSAYDSGSSAYDSGSSAYDSASSPYDSSSSLYASASSPYVSVSSPYASASSPYESTAYSGPPTATLTAEDPSSHPSYDPGASHYNSYSPSFDSGDDSPYSSYYNMDPSYDPTMTASANLPGYHPGYVSSGTPHGTLSGQSPATASHFYTGYSGSPSASSSVSELEPLTNGTTASFRSMNANDRPPFYVPLNRFQWK